MSFVLSKNKPIVGCYIFDIVFFYSCYKQGTKNSAFRACSYIVNDARDITTQVFRLISEQTGSKIGII